MKLKILLLIVFLFSFINIQAQIEEKEQLNQNAEFPSGVNGFRQRLIANIDFDLFEFIGKITTTLSFTIDENGDLKNIKAIGNNQYFNEEVVRVVKSIKTKWKPAKKDGKVIESTFSAPLTVNSH